MHLFSVMERKAANMTRTFRSQLAFNKRLDGFRSRWRTSAECSALSARRV